MMVFIASSVFFFATETARTGGHQILGKLVKKEFRNWKNALEVFAGHESKIQYNQLDLASKHRIEENRKRILPIIDTIILYGRQCISLRGHRDSGPIDSDIDPIENDGNFKAILRSKLRYGDEILKLHLESMSKTATYLSAKTQNEIINACGDIITKKIVNKIIEAKFFSILADESTDISCIEQFSLYFCFYNSTTMKIEENFLKFVPVTNLTGQSLANALITTLEGLNINSNFMVGQGYDGSSSISGAFHGVQAYIRAKYSSAIYVHCASYSLNLAISDACTVPQVRNSMPTLSKLCNFFRTPKRQNVFATEIEKTINIDLSQAILLAKTVRNTLAEMRQNAVQEFKKIFETAQPSCEKYGVEISVPRVTSRQRKRDNVPHSTPEEYFRRTIFVPFVDSFILHLDERLLSHDQILRSFAVIIPSENKNQEVNEVPLRQLYAAYEYLLDVESFEIVLGEVKLWYTVWKENNETPKTAMDALAFLLQNNTKLFLKVEALLKIFVTIPVTTPSNERTFSTLRRLKTYLRNTTRENRLNGLALLSIHREIPVSVDKVINLFPKQKNRRLEFFL
ncbi:hypothetical protein ILUMI_16014 [Ignelater luminosus]|uniref:Repressor of the inhibitor of the protein kinase n=1 Tax=Ignelater luminosus TaxID=2038154 RepID=A0A8K0G8K6_IGNLU|nr:hypothetical protein ILUMI_16014 [Ignelater luminosus]